ncbi:MAG: DUF503 domain-containing protein [Chthonomonadales bacterium]|nr:DUF503 domain-containing protein [Chthonomonadales bacterium]
MSIGSLTVVLRLPEAQSLKDKRQVVKSLIEVVRRRFNVAVAEVDDLEQWRRATIGIVCVSNDAAHTNRMLDKVLDFIESNPAYTVAEVEMEML